jgi:protein-L-isoaspartate(D-aspartate) O-methyltransferase
VTAGARDLPAAWWRQLATHGRIVVPLTLHGSGLTRSIAFDRHSAGHLVSDSALVCGFVPMRGSAADAGRTLQLAAGITLNIDASDDAAETALADVHGGGAYVSVVRCGFSSDRRTSQSRPRRIVL